MVENEIYISEFNKNKNIELVIEGDENSIFAYILKHTEESIGLDFDGFICSRGKIVVSSLEVKKDIDKLLSPPLMLEYKNEFSIQKGIKNADITIHWNDNLVSVKLNEVEFLMMDIENRLSYSKAISKKGSYGIPLNKKN